MPEMLNLSAMYGPFNWCWSNRFLYDWLGHCLNYRLRLDHLDNRLCLDCLSNERLCWCSCCHNRGSYHLLSCSQRSIQLIEGHASKWPTFMNSFTCKIFLVKICFPDIFRIDPAWSVFINSCMSMLMSWQHIRSNVSTNNWGCCSYRYSLINNVLCRQDLFDVSGCNYLRYHFKNYFYLVKQKKYRWVLESLW